MGLASNPTDSGQRFGLLARWVQMASKRAIWVVLASVSMSALALNYTIQNLRINTNTGEMFSPDLPFRRDLDRYQTLFPQFKENLIAVVEADTPEAASSAAVELGARLAAKTDLFKSVDVPREDEFLVQHGLLYQSIEDLTELSDRLVEMQPYLGRLTHDQSLRGLFKMLKAAVEAQDEGREINLSPVFSRIGRAIEALLAGRPYHLSWQELIGDEEATPDQLRQFIVMRPVLDYSQLFPGRLAIDAVRGEASAMGLNQSGSASLRLTGGVALSHEELQEVSSGASIIFATALVMVGVVVFIGLRSLRLMLLSMVTLLSGLILTACFAALAIGHLNLISVAFSVLYVGLGADFAIHFSLRLEELVAKGADHLEALRIAAQDVGASLVACAVTTAASFYAFVPTSFLGVSELGLIAGTGMFISLLATLTLLPALLTLFPLKRGKRLTLNLKLPLLSTLCDLPLRRPVSVRVGSLVLALLALALLPLVRFDWNPLDLRNPSSESVKTFRSLLRSSETPPWHITVLSPDAESAADRAHQLRDLPEVGKVIRAADFIPEDQADKIEVIDELSILLGPELSETPPAVLQNAAPDALVQVGALRDLYQTLGTELDGSDDGLEAGGRRVMHARLGALLAALDASSKQAQARRIEQLQDSLLSTLPLNLDRLRASLQVGVFGMTDLPQRLRTLWVAGDGTHRVAVFPSQDLNDSDALAGFVAAVKAVDSHATDLPVAMAESGKAVMTAFQQAITYALLVTGLVLMIALRSFVATILVFIPLLLAGFLTGATMVLLGLQLNFANIIALPLLLGIGVDNGIHMVHRTRSRLAGDNHPLRTSTARGVVFSALTTICSFGNLSFSPHLGTASMGQLLLIGITLALVCSLFVLPALLTRSLPESVS